MFWGLVLKSNRRYSQAVKKAFHVSQATLDVGSIGEDDEAIIEVWLNTDGDDHLLCNLNKQTLQVPLDLAFTDGETVAFFSKGSGTVHLSGYLMPDDEFDFPPQEADDESIDDEEEVELDAESKKALKQALQAKIQAADADEDDEDESDDEDFDIDGLEEGDDEELDEDSDDDDDEEDDDDEDDDEEDDDDDDEEDEEEISQPPAKIAKLDKQAKVNGIANGKATKAEQKKDQNQQQKKQKQQQPEQPQQKEQQKNQQDKKQQNQQKPQQKTLAGGVIVEDLRVGKGPEAKPGKTVQVYYEGRLKQNNKVFDSTKAGEGFKFRLGQGEVIRGWDVGVSGMRVGSKRRITCPPNAAYGPRGQPPVIPPNSTLVFDVELRHIK